VYSVNPSALAELACTSVVEQRQAQASALPWLGEIIARRAQLWVAQLVPV
jgi:hypothetical protein